VLFDVIYNTNKSDFGRPLFLNDTRFYCLPLLFNWKSGFFSIFAAV